jgi:hypothetical protein
MVLVRGGRFPMPGLMLYVRLFAGCLGAFVFLYGTNILTGGLFPDFLRYLHCISDERDELHLSVHLFLLQVKKNEGRYLCLLNWFLLWHTSYCRLPALNRSFVVHLMPPLPRAPTGDLAKSWRVQLY